MVVWELIGAAQCRLCTKMSFQSDRIPVHNSHMNSYQNGFKWKWILQYTFLFNFVSLDINEKLNYFTFEDETLRTKFNYRTKSQHVSGLSISILFVFLATFQTRMGPHFILVLGYLSRYMCAGGRMQHKLLDHFKSPNMKTGSKCLNIWWLYSLSIQLQ